MRVLGVNAISHDPAAAPVVDGQVVAAADEERCAAHARWLAADRDAAYRPGARAMERFGLDRFLAGRGRILEEETCASR